MRKITMIFALLAALTIALPAFASDDTDKDKASEDTTTETEVAGDATPPSPPAAPEPVETEGQAEKERGSNGNCPAFQWWAWVRMKKRGDAFVSPRFVIENPKVSHRSK